MRLVVLTDIPSPYQVELFNVLASRAGWRPTIIYFRRSAGDRSWETPPIRHEHFFLGETSDSELDGHIADCDLAVFSGYRPTKVKHLMQARNRLGRAWAFWGERPGFRFPGWFGRQYRAWKLREVRSSHAAVWGIGHWAVEGYRSEVGGRRLFFNVPYFSNLAPFFAIDRQFRPKGACRFLFSGSMIERKGVDLLTNCFVRLLTEGIDAELHLLGTGPLENDLKAKCRAFRDKVYVHGFKQWNQLASVYAQADILCAPSRYDGWGLVVVEGLAAGMPVISTNRTGSALELINSDNGWLVPAGDEDALYLAMKSAAALGREDLGSMSRRAREIATRQDVQTGAERFAHAADVTVGDWQCGMRSFSPSTRAKAESIQS